MGKKILFCGYDIERKHQRGIGYFTKALLCSTHELKYRNYLLTSGEKASSDILRELNILKKIADPSNFGVSKQRLMFRYFLHYLTSGFQKVDRKYFKDAEEDFGMLEYVKGFVNKSSFYDIVHLQTYISDTPIRLRNPYADIVFTLNPINIRTNKRVKLIQTIHDLIPMAMAEHYSQKRYAVRFRRSIESALRYSNKVICVSNFTKNDLTTIYPEYADCIEVAHQPVPINTHEEFIANDPMVQTEILSKFELGKQEFFLYVGYIEKRKNIHTLIEAYQKTNIHSEIPLVLAGDIDPAYTEMLNLIEKNSFKNKIMYIGYIDNVAKLVLLKNAIAFVFPTMYEGFGLPPLEAMHMGCPVICSNTTSLPEVCGDAVLYVDPTKSDDWAAAFIKISFDSNLRNDLIIRGYAQANKFTYNQFKNKIQQIIKEVE